MEKDPKSPWLPRVLAPIVRKIVPPRDYEKQEAAQRAASLRPEVQPGEPGYTVWATLNVLLPTILAAPLAVNLLSWIAGRGFGAGLYSFALNFSTFVVAMVSWRFVRKINRELVELLQPQKEAVRI